VREKRQAVRRSARTVGAALLFFLTACPPAFAQCPDGTPPPCTRPIATRAGAAPPANSVAVLYFDARTRDSNDLYLADGLTEEIITRLSTIERLTVRSRHAVQRFKGAALADPAATARALNVTYIVTGSVRRAGGRLRVSAELIRAEGGAQVWGRQFDQAGDDVFAIQEAVAGEVATGIVGRLLPSETRAIAARPTTSRSAYEAYLRGNFHLARRDSAGLVRAVREYEAAVRADPTFTEARSRQAGVYGIAHGNGVNIGLPAETLAARALRLATDAVQRSPASSDAWYAMGIARIAADPLRLTGAVEALERAIALDPGNAEPHHLLGFAHEVLGRDSLGLIHDRHALAINPARGVTVWHLALEAMRRGDYAQALAWSDTAAAVDPAFRRNEAAHAALLLLVRGDSVRARRLLADVRTAPGRPVGVSAGGPLAMALLVVEGDREGALATLQAAVPRGAFLRYVMSMPIFDPLRQDPRFVRLWREAGGE
jgi:TolB-like protein/tetratricopeptide (TPR) repeat protein